MIPHPIKTLVFALAVFITAPVQAQSQLLIPFDDAEASPWWVGDNDGQVLVGIEEMGVEGGGQRQPFGFDTQRSVGDILLLTPTKKANAQNCAEYADIAQGIATTLTCTLQQDTISLREIIHTNP